MAVDPVAVAPSGSVTEVPSALTGTSGQIDWPIEIRPNGTVMYDGIAIGGLDFTEGEPSGPNKPMVEHGEPRLTLNLGWLRAAGLRVRVLDDPAVERHRDGITLDR